MESIVFPFNLTSVFIPIENRWAITHHEYHPLIASNVVSQ
nr:MAG TPA: hypothetical protein [Caudoviricetes sp.]